MYRTVRLFGRNIKLKLSRNVPRRPKGGRGIALPLFDPGARKGREVSATAWPLYLLERDLLPLGWASLPVWTCS